MTEADWDICDNPEMMLEFLREGDRLSERKGRLFAVACCRRIWHLLIHAVSRHAVEVGERFADGLATDYQQSLLYQAAGDVVTLLSEALREDLAELDPSFADPVTEAGMPRYAAVAAAEAAVAAADFSAVNVAAHLAAANAVSWMTANGDEPDDTAEAEEQWAQASLLRDLLGNPFRPSAIIDPVWLAWNDGTVRRLAEDAYEQRDIPDGTLDPQRLGILADALEDAGCSNHEVLHHLRRQGMSHYRGCWVLDLLLGRE